MPSAAFGNRRCTQVDLEHSHILRSLLLRSA
jgi:hypothetical protein